MLKKCWIWLCIVLFVGTVPVLAHVQNENSLYSDIAFSEAQEEVVILRGIGAIALEGGANLFKPYEILTLHDLAYWAGNFIGLGGEDAGPDDIRQAALAEGLVASLEGDATYGDVNQAYFAGLAPVDDDSAGLTREEFARYMGQFFEQSVAGQSLIDRSGYTAGPSGIVEQVDTITITEGDNSYDVFQIQIDGVGYALTHHPKVLYGPVDLTQWAGKHVEASWYAPDDHAQGGERQLGIVKLRDAEFSPDEIAAADEAAAYDHGGHAGADSGTVQHTAATADEGITPTTGGPGGQPALPIILIIGGVILIVIIGWLMLRRKQS